MSRIRRSRRPLWAARPRVPVVRFVLGCALGCLAVVSPARATSLFDPTVASETFADTSPVVLDALGLPLWDRIERLDDGDSVLFGAEQFPPGATWDDADPYAPHVATAFGAAEPPSGRFLLHFAPGWSQADHPVPVLLVPGAASSASGVFPVLARALASAGRSVFGLTFPHPHGDNWQQAELVADAIARVRSLTGAASVDVVAHSKGGIATAVYLAHRAGQTWGEPGGRGARYSDRGTAYRGDVRRLVTVGTPWGGLDTAFRWTAPHLAHAMGGELLVPQAWAYHYPLTTAQPFVYDDLRAVDLWPDEGDAFAGQAQMLRRWDAVHALPGSRLDLEGYALQQDWWTTYEGGLGLVSESWGIDDAIEQSGDLIEQLQEHGIDPSVEVVLIAGGRPLIPVDRAVVRAEPFGEAILDIFGQDAGWYRTFISSALDADFPDLEITDEEAAALSRGDLLFGEISGASDGLVFTASALDRSVLDRRGASVRAEHTFALSHLDLLFASPLSGQALITEAAGDAALAWRADLGARYTVEDSVTYIVDVLGDPPDPGDDDSGDDDSVNPGDDDVEGDDDSALPGDDDDATLPEDAFDGCGCAQDASPVAPTFLGFALLLLLRRRPRCSACQPTPPLPRPSV